MLFIMSSINNRMPQEPLLMVDMTQPIRLVGINERNDVGVYHERFEMFDLERGLARTLGGQTISLLPSAIILRHGLRGLFELPDDVNDYLITHEPLLACGLFLAHVYDTIVIIQTTPSGTHYIGCVDEASATLISMHIRTAMTSERSIYPTTGTEVLTEFVKTARKLIPGRYSSGAGGGGGGGGGAGGGGAGGVSMVPAD